jgi:hypothetical protein
MHAKTAKLKKESSPIKKLEDWIETGNRCMTRPFLISSFDCCPLARFGCNKNPVNVPWCGRAG